MKLLCRILAVILLTACLLHETTSASLKCAKEKSKNCMIPLLVQSYPSVEIYLPDLSKKSSLQILAGNLTSFSEKMSKQLGTVEKLQLGPIQLKDIFLKPELVELTAGGNQIEVIKFRTNNADYKMQLLDLRDNRLKNLDGFEILTELRELHLEGNALETVDLLVFNDMSNLEKLFLQRNQLTTVIARELIELPALEYLSLSENKLSSLDVSNWLLESLTECDLSMNSLVYINELEKRFPSMHTINLARNWWDCLWLEDTLKLFNENSVTIEGRNESCDGKEHVSSICCVPVIDTHITNDDQTSRLKSLKETLNVFVEKLTTRLKTMEDEQEAKLARLEKNLKEVEKKAKILIPTSAADSMTRSEFVELKSRAQTLKSSLEEQLAIWKKQNKQNNLIKQRLQHTIIDLRRSLDREMKKINEGQAQFSLLRDYVRSKLNKRN